MAPPQGRDWSAIGDSETYAWFQRIHCVAEIEIAPGLHIVGEPAADGMVPVALDVAPLDGLEVGAVTWPAPAPLRLDGLDADLQAHEGTIRGSLPLTFTAAPGAGDLRLCLTVTYQACDRTTCLPPSSITLELPIREAPLVDRALPAADAKTP
jgi:DsbC/DsbD-like thiol-disulfide interchange protein